MKKMLSIVFLSLFFFSLSLLELKAFSQNVSTKDQVGASLESYYNGITNKTPIFETYYFNINSFGDNTPSPYDNAGLLSEWEVNQIGLNSYLINKNTFFVLSCYIRNELMGLTPTGIVNVDSTSKHRIKVSIYLKGETIVKGKGTRANPYEIQ